MNAPRLITIVVRDGNDFDVHEGERYAARLCWDEMLGEIASLTHPAIPEPRYSMQTPEFYQEREERYRAMRENATSALVTSEAEALERFVQEWGERSAGAADALLPPEQQSPLVRSAMQALATVKQIPVSTLTPETA